MTTVQHFPETVVVDAVANLPVAPLVTLADNALCLADTAGLTRRDLLLDRAQLWEQLASSTTPACAQAYRAVAVVCREEAHLLGDGW